MAGHSKWNNIKRRKAASDSKRGKLFTRLLREIQVAAKMGGSSVESNPRLKNAVQSAKSLSVPADNIERAINRGTGQIEGAEYEEVTYEAYGPGGVAIIIKSLTDNRHRTAAELRHVLSRNNGNLAGSNAVLHNFKLFGVISVPKTAIAEEQLFALVVDRGAEDLKDEDSHWEVYFPPEKMSAARQALESSNLDLQAEVKWIPLVSVNVSGETAKSLFQLLDALDDLDDVQSFTANFEVDESELLSLGQ